MLSKIELATYELVRRLWTVRFGCRRRSVYATPISPPFGLHSKSVGPARCLILMLCTNFLSRKWRASGSASGSLWVSLAIAERSQ